MEQWDPKGPLGNQGVLGPVMTWVSAPPGVPTIFRNFFLGAIPVPRGPTMAAKPARSLRRGCAGPMEPRYVPPPSGFAPPLPH